MKITDLYANSRIVAVTNNGDSVTVHIETDHIDHIGTILTIPLEAYRLLDDNQFEGAKPLL